jgi:hypothetical protein
MQQPSATTKLLHLHGRPCCQHTSVPAFAFGPPLPAGLKDGEAPAADDAPRLVEIVLGAMPSAGREVVAAAVAARPQRASAYL